MGGMKANSARAMARLVLVAAALGCGGGSSGVDSGADADAADATADGGGGAGGEGFDAADAPQLGDASCQADADNVRTSCFAKTATTVYLCPFRQEVATCPAGCAVDFASGPFDREVVCRPAPDAGADAETDAGADASDAG
jgi:hypothetical protein